MVSERLVWVTSSSHDLRTLLQQQGLQDKTSPFPNIFSTMPIFLGALEQTEAMELVVRPAQNAGIRFSPAETMAIHKLAGGLPYFLQAVAEQWFLTKKEGIPAETCPDRVQEELLAPYSRIQEQMASYWKHLTEEERACLYQALRGELGHRPATNAEKVLLSLGLLTELDAQLQINGELLGQWISQRGNLPTPPPPPSLEVLRGQLKRGFDDVDLDAFCLDHFRDVYDRFTRGMRKDEKINLLLDHCCRLPTEYQQLADLLRA